MNLFDKLQKIVEQKESEIYLFDVVMENNYEKQIEKVMLLNPLYKMNEEDIKDTYYLNKKIFKYFPLYTKAKLVKEPKNEYDPNAIFVKVSGNKIGYITMEDNRKVSELMKKNITITATIIGGKYKSYYTTEEGLSGFYNNSFGYSAKIFIEVKKVFYKN